MTEKLTETLLESLKQPADALFYQLSLSLQDLYPDLSMLETESYYFDVGTFAADGHCVISELEGAYSEHQASPSEHCATVTYESYNTFHSVEWEGTTFILIETGLIGEYVRKSRHFLLSPSEEANERFFLAVCKWSSEIRGEVLVFNECWNKSEALYNDIQSSTLENLVLEGELKKEIETDFSRFFDSRELYRKYNIPWKRGVLLLGPPGNGKTHCVKALINKLKVPCLYVQSFEMSNRSDNAAISEVFQRARASAPCIVVLEDLDSLLNDRNRSFFLNEMDGFDANEGVMVVASTNHPERLDPAIIERPSRFDRKYTFNLPDLESRRDYLMMFSSSLEPALQLSDDNAIKLAELTDGFSYAYLKELFLSAMMEWIHNSQVAFTDILVKNVDALRGQMLTPPVEASGDERAFDPAAYMRRWQRPRR